ncbi:hypothetical protein [Bdellovibrio sp. HCB-162]|uniref:hypothetical protein n=1 Tax=Bdellovibrio sp. HCB-162 TaxID=3394234 RepID=UPI0039BC8C94
MVKDQIFTAKNEFELYEALRKNVSVDDFIDGHIVVGHICKNSENSYRLTEIFVHTDILKNFEFQKKFPEEDCFWVLDARGDFEEMSFGGNIFHVTVVITEVTSWVTEFDVSETNAEFDDFILRQVRGSLASVTKKLAG